MMKLRNLKLENKFFLAPMAEINDIAFRELCSKAGASLCYTGMINPLTQQKLQLDDKPAIQLFSTNEKGIAEFINKNDSKCSLWDFNLGCPAKNAKKLGFGSFMCHKLPEIEKILKAMRENTDKPLTIKIRKSKNALKILKIAEKYCDAICIHPRTQEQGYSGRADLEYALRIKKKTNLPVIYSGDVDENNAKKISKQFDFLMIGRAAVGNPNIFTDTIKKLMHNEPNKQGLSINKKSKRIGFKDYLELAEKHKLYFSQIKLQAMNFTKGMKNGKDMRRKLIFAKTIKQVREIYGI